MKFIIYSGLNPLSRLYGENKEDDIFLIDIGTHEEVY